MNPRRDDRSEPTDQVERIVYDAICDLGWVIPQSEEDVERTEWVLGQTKTELPEQLRDPYAVFDQTCENRSGIVAGEGAGHEFTDAEDGLQVFGSFIRSMRRKKKLSIEQLAKNARVDSDELQKIETDPDFEVMPRTVHQLAMYLGLPKRTLLKLSNLTTVHDSGLRNAAVRFAAHSTKLAELSRDERKALAEFVKYLVSKDKSEDA